MDSFFQTSTMDNILKKILIGSIICLNFAVPAYAANNVEDISTDRKKNKVESIDIPEDMERNYDQLLHLWASNNKGTVNCDYDSDATVLYHDSVYINRLYSLPTQMELAFNPIVKQYIEMYASRRKGQVAYMLGLGRYYFPMFEEALDREGLPLELKYLPVIESALNPIARSRVGATGLWQFMSATGKLYKLEINSLVDERRDPQKSTQAAVQYLKDMYEVYNDWNLVIAAYNCGPGNVNKAIKRSGGKRDYWDIYPYLPKETRGYVPAFIAATYIMNYYPKHNICPQEVDLPLLIDTLNINKVVHFQQIAEVLDIPIDKIRKLNPQYKEDIIPGEHKDYALKLPVTQLSAFIDKEDTIYAHRAEELLTHKKTRDIASMSNAPASGGYATYRVKRGDTLGAIAMRHGVSVAQLKNWNNMRSDKLSVGKTLQVSAYIAPKKTQKQDKVNSTNIAQQKESEFVVENGILKKATTTTKETVSNYVVKKGDTWSAIAKKTGASIANIKSWNGIRSNKLTAGNTLKIRKTEIVKELEEIAKPEAIVATDLSSEALSFMDAYIERLGLETPNTNLDSLLNVSENTETIIDSNENGDFDENLAAIYHKVSFGETLSQIAQKYNVTVEDILSWNNITQESSKNVTRLLILLPQDEENGANQV